MVDGDNVDVSECLRLRAASGADVVGLAACGTGVAGLTELAVFAALIAMATSVDFRRLVVAVIENFVRSRVRSALHVRRDNLSFVGGIVRWRSTSRLCQRPVRSSS